MEDDCLIHGKCLLCSLKHQEIGMFWSFSDKNFDQGQKVNPKNDRWLHRDTSEVPIVMITKFPAIVMVLGVASNEGHVILPHFFPWGLRVSAAVYTDVLEKVGRLWIDSIINRSYICQQNSAPFHKAWTNFHHHVTSNTWSPNPLNYYVWVIVERKDNQHFHNNILSLESVITKIMSKID